LGEIDFIATTKTDIAFVEVKTRSQADSRFGSPADSVNKSKQQKLLRAVHGFLARNPGYYNLRPHVDVCTIVLIKLDRGDYSAKIIENSVEDWF
jgi:putative endonuclease